MPSPGPQVLPAAPAVRGDQVWAYARSRATRRRSGRARPREGPGPGGRVGVRREAAGADERSRWLRDVVHRVERTAAPMTEVVVGADASRPGDRRAANEPAGLKAAK